MADTFPPSHRHSAPLILYIRPFRKLSYRSLKVVDERIAIRFSEWQGEAKSALPVLGVGKALARLTQRSRQSQSSPPERRTHRHEKARITRRSRQPRAEDAV